MDIAVDVDGNAYVTGDTSSTDFPTVNPLQSGGGGATDAFVTKLNDTGSALVYSTYLGGSSADEAFGIAVDSAGNAHLTGMTRSSNFPTANPLQPTLSGTRDAFVTKLSPAGSALVYSTYLGGSSTDGGSGIAVDASGNAYLVGDTDSLDFPTVNPLQPAVGSAFFIARVSEGNKLYFTQFGNGILDEITLRSDIVLPNPSATETASGTVMFSQTDGSAFTTEVEGLGSTSSVAFDVSPLDSTTISTTGQGEFGTGTAVVSSDRPLGGVIRFDISAPAGVGSGIAGVPASQILSGFVTPVRRLVNGINTGLAIRNVGSGEVTLDLSLRFEDGDPVPDGSTTRTIVGEGQLVDFINGLFPAVFPNPPDGPEIFVGSLVVTSDGVIAATAIEQGTNPGEFTTLPVTPLE